MLVCAGHLRAEFFVDFGQLQTPDLVDKIFYFATGLGHQAVMVFFVLSGFFVGGSVLKSGRFFSAQNYTVSRLSRLWTVLVPALIITALLDWATLQLQPTIIAGARYNEWNSGPMAGAYSASIGTFVANLFFLQTITAPVFGSNGPLWSLANEFWYYLLFPLMTSVAALTGKYKISTRLVLGGFLIIVFRLLPSGIIGGFFVWLMGVAAYALSQRITRKSRPVSLFVAGVIFLLALAYSKLPSWQSISVVSEDLIVGFGFAAFYLMIASWPIAEACQSDKTWRSLGRMTSEFSYSLYLIHFPVLVLLSASVLPKLQMTADASGYAAYFGTLALLIGSGFLFWFAFEKKTPQIRQLILSHLSRLNKP